MATNEWYYDAGNSVSAGPVTLEELVALRSSGRISKQTRVWTAGMENWTAYSEVGLPVAVFEAREPPKPKPLPQPAKRGVSDTEPFLYNGGDDEDLAAPALYMQLAAAIARVDPVRVRLAILVLWLLASLLTFAMPHCRFTGTAYLSQGAYDKAYVVERYDFIWHHVQGEGLLHGRREVLVAATVVQEFAVSIMCAILFAATYLLPSKGVKTETGDKADALQSRT